MASASVVQWALSAGVPPLKWYVLENFWVLPLYVKLFVILMEGVAAMRPR